MKEQVVNHIKKQLRVQQRQYFVKVNKEPDKLYFSLFGTVCISLVSVLMQ